MSLYFLFATCRRNKSESSPRSKPDHKRNIVPLSASLSGYTSQNAPGQVKNVKKLMCIADPKQPLGEGEGTFVYIGKNPEHAVKAFSSNIKLSRHDLQTELEKVLKLNDPTNVVRIHDVYLVFAERGIHFSIIMDRCQLSLKQLIYEKNSVDPKIPNARVAVPLRKKVEILSGVARGVAFLHRSGITHGNLKSSNVFIPHQLPAQDDWSIHVKVSDYCIEKFIASSPHILPLDAKHSEKDGIVRVEWGHEVDVFSYGLLAFEMSLGKFPSIKESLEGSWEWVKHNELEMRKDLFELIPPEEFSVMGDLIKACLKPSPERLPMTGVQEMVDIWIRKLKEKVDIPLMMRSIPSSQVCCNCQKSTFRVFVLLITKLYAFF